MSRLVSTLKFQISVALLVLLALLAANAWVGQYVLTAQLTLTKVVEVGSRLQYASQQLANQAMNYLENAPRDFGTYSRDLNLYYRDLMNHIEGFDMLENAFMTHQFDRQLTGMDDMMEPELGPEVGRAVDMLHDTWRSWRAGLMQRLGEDSDPRLEWAAAYITQNANVLKTATDALLSQLQRHANRHHHDMRTLNQASLIVSVLLTLGIMFWFYRQVLRPLGQLSTGLREVSLGEFGYQLEKPADNEIGWMSERFNALSLRLDALFRLLTRLQQGSNLDDTLRFVAEEFQPLLPLDWVGVLFVTGDNRVQLERGYGDSRLEAFGTLRFALQNTLLAQAIEQGEPLHITELPQRASANPQFQFLQVLADHGYQEAIFLPLPGDSPLAGVLAFGACREQAFSDEQLALLRNIALLVTLSFGRTVRLAEAQRLAVIGQFASSIAHEIRSPLSTISMALDYLQQPDQPPSARKRAQLAGAEAERMRRLMEDILLYAKPLQLRTRPLQLDAFIGELAERQQPLFAEKQQHFELIAPPALPAVEVDCDRITQVFVNLLQNAAQAAPNDAVILCTLSHLPGSNWLDVELQNPGPAIEPQALRQLFEPFFTTRAHGTGLGLSIVKRIIEAHGGLIDVTSDDSGTCFRLRLHLAQTSAGV